MPYFGKIGVEAHAKYDLAQRFLFSYFGLETENRTGKIS